MRWGGIDIDYSLLSKPTAISDRNGNRPYKYTNCQDLWLPSAVGCHTYMYTKLHVRGVNNSGVHALAVFITPAHILQPCRAPPPCREAPCQFHRCSPPSVGCNSRSSPRGEPKTLSQPYFFRLELTRPAYPRGWQSTATWSK